LLHEGLTLVNFELFISQELHHLVVTETDLPKHLGIVKDFFLGGRGELFHDFLISLMKSVNPDSSENENPEDVMKNIGKTKMVVFDGFVEFYNLNLPKTCRCQSG